VRSAPRADLASSGRSLGARAAAFLGRGAPAATNPAPARRAGSVAALALLALLAVVPVIGLRVPWVLPGSVGVLDSPGNLEVFALCFLFATAALGFDLLFGFTGLLSFGQALYFASGAYLFDVACSDWHWAALAALVFALVVSTALGVVLGSVALRVEGIAFAMVTLAFAEAGYYLIEQNPHGLTGGDSGLVLATNRLPPALVGVVNTDNLYWVALGVLVVGFAAVWLATESVTGRVWLAIRENERRVEVIGLVPFWFKLGAVGLSSLLTALAGVAYALVVGTVSPSSVASTTVTISLLVMVVLGGVGTRWGAVLGAMIYVYLEQVLVKVAAEPSFLALPAVLRVPLGEPQFLLGLIFVVFVLFAPSGLAGIWTALRRRRSVRFALAGGRRE
jgi:branched-chain amino acid transport system permease protein